MSSRTLALAAALTLAGFASGAQAMAEFNMVEDTLKAFLVELRIPAEKADTLTLAQMREIIAIVDSKEMGDGARVQVLKIMDGN